MLNRSTNIIVVVLLFVTNCIVGQTDVAHKLNAYYEGREYSSIVKYYNNSYFKNPNYSDSELLYLGLGLYKTGHLIAPYQLLSKLNKKSDLTKKQKRAAKKTLKKVKDKGLTGFNYNTSGKTYLEAKSYSKAKIEFQKAIEIDPLHSSLYYKLLTIALEQKNTVEAEKNYNKHITSSPKHIKAYLNMAYYMYHQENNVAKALETLSPLKRISKVNYYYARARIYKYNKQYKLALREAKNIALSERSDNSNKLLGNIHHQLGNYSKSNRFLLPLFKKKPNNSDAETLAINYFNIASYNNSISFLDFIFKTDSASHYPYYLKGLCILRKIGGYPHGKPKVRVAEKYFKMAIDLDSTIAKYHYRHGLSLNYGGKREEAVAAFDRAIKITPLDYDIWDAKWRSIMSDKNKKKERALGKSAIKVFEKAYLKDSSVASIAFGLGMAYDLSNKGLYKKYAVDRARKSIYYLEKAIDLDPYQLNYYKELDMNYSYGYEKERYQDRRIPLALKEVKHLPNEGHGYKELFYLYCKKGDYEKANEAYIGMCENAPNYWLLDQTHNSVYDKRKKYNWRKLPVEYYRHASWKYVDSISAILANNEWVKMGEGCNSISRKFTFNIKSKTVKVNYSSPIDWQNGQVTHLVYDILGSYKNGLKLRIQGEHRKSWNDKVQIWDLIMFNEKQFKWREYPTRDPYYFHSTWVNCP